nr:translation initiation factor IF-2-like [Gorilla gorilla gorilla]
MRNNNYTLFSKVVRLLQPWTTYTKEKISSSSQDPAVLSQTTNKKRRPHRNPQVGKLTSSGFRGDRRPEPRGARGEAPPAGFGPKPARDALSSAQQTGRPSGGPRNGVFSAPQEGERPRELGRGRGREQAGAGGERGAEAAGERGPEAEEGACGAGLSPAAIVDTCSGWQFPPRPKTAATEAERAQPPSSQPARPPHLDLPTPLSPMMRLFRVQHVLVHPNPAALRAQLAAQYIFTR